MSKQCADCGRYFSEGEAWDVRGQWLCLACQVHRAMKSKAAQPAKPKAQTKTKRDAADECRVRAMRAFYAAAKRDGLDVNDAQRMKVALSQYLGCPVPSRRDLSAGQWREAAAGIEFCLLAW